MTFTRIKTNYYTSGKNDEITHIVKTKIETGIVKMNGINKFFKIKTPISDYGFKYILNPEKIDKIFGTLS